MLPDAQHGDLLVYDRRTWFRKYTDAVQQYSMYTPNPHVNGVALYDRLRGNVIELTHRGVIEQPVERWFRKFRFGRGDEVSLLRFPDAVWSVRAAVIMNARELMAYRCGFWRYPFLCALVEMSDPMCGNIDRAENWFKLAFWRKYRLFPAELVCVAYTPFILNWPHLSGTEYVFPGNIVESKQFVRVKTWTDLPEFVAT